MLGKVPAPADVLIRPDGYVGFAATVNDGAGAEAYLRNLAA